jgi:hypothetical protein
MKKSFALLAGALPLAIVLAGCAQLGIGGGNRGTPPPFIPAAAPGQVVGSGEKVHTATGDYERIALPENASVYKYNNGLGHPDYVAAGGWTEEDGATAQRAAVDYMVKEVFDSSALDGGDAGYQEWYATAAKKIFFPSIYEDPSVQSGEGSTLFGNYHGKVMPILIHDGAPRAKSVDLQVAGVSSFDDEAGIKGIRTSFDFTVDYRVSDKEAAEFAGRQTKQGTERFLASTTAKDQLKDGVGENIYTAKGQENVIVVRDANNEWKVYGAEELVEFFTSDFAHDVPPAR